MAERSPNYPAIGLTEAISLATKLYRIEKRSPASAAVAVAAWGYSGVNGAARSRLSALRKYGLLEKSGGAYKLTNRAMTMILHEDGSPEFLAAAREAARAPELFRALANDFMDGSETNLRNHLMLSMSFTESGARQVTKAFRETMAVAKFGDAVYDEPDDEPVSREPTGATVDGAVSLSGVPRLSALAESIPAKGGLLFSWPLAKGVMAEVRLTGGDIRPGHIDMLRQYLALAKTALQDDEPEPTAPSVTGQPVNDDDEEAPE